jgi:hypothetical protein
MHSRTDDARKEAKEMKPNTKKNAILAALFALTLLAGCGTGAAGAPGGGRAGTAGRGDASPAGNFAGKVEGTDAFVAVVVDEEDRALAYACDGREGGTATVAEWFRGEVADDGSLDLTSEGGAGLSADIAEEGASGTVTLDGEDHAFTAGPAEEPAGLYRKAEEADGEELLGGWIELASGEQRGAVRNRSAGFIQSDVDLARPSRPVNGFISSGIDF